MPKASPANAWVGAPPVSEGAFAFAHGDFFVEVSGHNRHRRATPQELETHFASGNDKDHPAHWFEAQLIHYGLQPSKTKSVARTRLLRAMIAGNLKVPADVTKIEGKLKKEWTKNDREAKKAAKASTSAPAKTAGAKRKVDDDAGPSKKARMIVTTTTTTTTTITRTITRKAPSSKDSATKAAPSTPAKKQTARRGAASSTTIRSTAATSQSQVPPTRPSGYDFVAPPPYSEYAEGGGYQSPRDSYGNDGYDNGYDDEASLAPLGLLNGDYEVDSEDVTSQWDYYHPDDFGLTLTLSGSSLWGRFNLGVYKGIFFIEDRPMRSSHDRVPFIWRGREDQGPIWYGNRNNGWIKFLGDGRIEGFLGAQSLSFQGRRFPDQPTRSTIDARSMKDEWDGYSEEAYECENRARW